MGVDYEKLYEKPKSAKQAAEEMGLALPDTDDMGELAASAIPDLVRRAIVLAQGTDKLSDVLSVLKELADRAYGKPKQAVDVKAHHKVDNDITVRVLSLLTDEQLKQIAEGSSDDAGL